MTERLMDAVLSLRYQQLEALLRQGVPVNSRNREGQTAAMVACYVPDPAKAYRMFRFLQRKGANVLARDAHETSVFQHACRRGLERVARRIVGVGGAASADLGGADQAGRSPLFHAASSGNAGLVAYLIGLMRARGVGVDAPDNAGVTPLIQASKMGHSQAASVLETVGRANPRICDAERHMNAAQWAEEAAGTRSKSQRDPPDGHRSHKGSAVRHPRPTGGPGVRPVLPSIRRAERSPETAKPRWQPGARNPDSTEVIGGKDWNGDSQRIAERNANSWVVRQSLDASSTPASLGKSTDAAMAMLELASHTSRDRSFARGFVSSKSVEASHTGDNGHHHHQLHASVNSLLGAYSSQFSSAFRKPAKLPPQPDPIEPPHEPPSLQKKPCGSTLAYILSHGATGGKTTKGSQRGSRRTPVAQRSSTVNRRKHLKVKATTSGRSSADSGWTDDASHGDGRPGVKPRRSRQKSVHESSPRDGEDRGRAGRDRGQEDRPAAAEAGPDRLPGMRPTRLNRVAELEDDPGQGGLPMPRSLNPRDSLPSVRVTIPSV